jgi:hypothetical protein
MDKTLVENFTVFLTPFRDGTDELEALKAPTYQLTISWTLNIILRN